MQTKQIKKQNKISLPATLTKPGNLKQKEAPPCICIEASYTAESIVVLPVFTTFMVILLFFFRVLQVQQVVGNALIDTGRELAVMAYEEENRIPSENAAAAKMILLKKLSSDSGVEQFVSGGIKGIVLIRSDFSGDYIRLKADYQIKIPIGLLGKHKISITQRTVCRKWTGNSLQQGKDGEEIVYITPNGTVYHRIRDCTYLKPSVQKISSSDIGYKRNENGGKYYECQKCMKNGNKCSMVYITQYGNRYHSTSNCSELKRTVMAVRLSEVKGRHACGKCGKEKS